MKEMCQIWIVILFGGSKCVYYQSLITMMIWSREISYLLLKKEVVQKEAIGRGIRAQIQSIESFSTHDWTTNKEIKDSNVIFRNWTAVGVWKVIILLLFCFSKQARYFYWSCPRETQKSDWRHLIIFFVSVS